MFKNVMRTLLTLCLGVVLTLGVGAAGCLASSGHGGYPCPECICEPVYMIVACGTCEVCDEREIPLCPPANPDLPFDTELTPVIDFVQVLNGGVRVLAHVDKVITYTDVNGIERVRFERVPLQCEIPIPGVVFTDTVANQTNEIILEISDISDDGRTFVEEICVQIRVSIQRLFACELVCNGD